MNVFSSTNYTFCGEVWRIMTSQIPGRFRVRCKIKTLSFYSIFSSPMTYDLVIDRFVVAKVVTASVIYRVLSHDYRYRSRKLPQNSWYSCVKTSICRSMVLEMKQFEWEIVKMFHSWWPSQTDLPIYMV